MKLLRVACCAAVLGVWTAGAKADDTIYLNDGSVIKGQVLEEGADHLTLMDHGLRRVLDRSMVTRVEFNSDGGSAAAPAPEPETAAPAPAVGGGDTVPSMPTQAQQDYALGVADFYGAQPEEVWGWQDRGLAVDELPVVYYLAHRAAVSPGYVVDLRYQGLPWADVCIRLGLSPDIFYWDDVFRADLGGPYSGLYFRFHRYRRAHWYWDNLLLTDRDIINLVNLRFTSDYWHRPVVEIAPGIVVGHPFFYVSFGFSSRYGAPYRIHRGGAWGAGYSNHYHAWVSQGRPGWQGRPAMARGGGANNRGMARGNGVPANARPGLNGSVRAGGGPSGPHAQVRGGASGQNGRSQNGSRSGQNKKNKRPSNQNQQNQQQSQQNSGGRPALGR
jgi:hypothetical protein